LKLSPYFFLGQPTFDCISQGLLNSKTCIVPENKQQQKNKIKTKSKSKPNRKLQHGKTQKQNTTRNKIHSNMAFNSTANTKGINCKIVPVKHVIQE